MGCANSKQKRRCRHCQAPYSPVHRSYSMNIEPHRHRTKDPESHHIVALKSSTLGSLKLDDPYREDVVRFGELISTNGGIGGDKKVCNENVAEKESFRIGLIEAKTWSHMMEEKIPKPAPKTPIGTPPGEPETINTWELMEGLEDVTPSRSPINHSRSFSFDVVRSPGQDHTAPLDRPKSRFQESTTAEVDPPKHQPIWLQMSQDDGLNANGFVSEIDPDILLNFRKSFEELSPSHPFHIRPLSSQEKPTETKSEQPYHKERVIVYFTSLRGVRKTYEDCCHVRIILKATGVRIDERDVSMHSGFKDELKELLGEALKQGSGYGLPRVFVGKNCIGGAEEIRRMHEEGKLEKFLEGCERADNNSGDGNTYACEACGNIRFVPCETCSGSCKIFCGDDFEDEEPQQQYETEEGEYGFQRCPDCNENGLIRCPICCD
ncbi:uncharacterized protein At3g28850-like [Punica granatum]|uniref:Glutaredoxin domain-containing protein n=2 Tax=Punica granatum TaxID=22663 RepID=A0A218WMT7_PUNGR|nr:uncharacterized protein At3g28850-like [Punica granatum]OWM73966.1 hypothetical protein CDL15_Pgr022237 [Punica granatum]PKI46546.1 hypothetical protein CRG98_033103 [Punica granatum]